MYIARISPLEREEDDAALSLQFVISVIEWFRVPLNYGAKFSGQYADAAVADQAQPDHIANQTMPFPSRFQILLIWCIFPLFF